MQTNKIKLTPMDKQDLTNLLQTSDQDYVIEFDDEEIKSFSPNEKTENSDINLTKPSVIKKKLPLLKNKSALIKKKKIKHKSTNMSDTSNNQSDNKVVKSGSDNKNMANKKGPGRPRKNPKKNPIPRNGIASTPIDEDNIIEVLYAMPIYFKKIIAFFKSLAASQLQIIFRYQEIIIYADDHHNKSKIRVCFNATKLNHYYCGKEFQIGINCHDLELILNKVDKEYNSIIMLSNKEHNQEHITINLENEMQIDETHTIDLVGQYPNMNEAAFLDENYMIKFTLPGKYFRKTINDIKTMSNQLEIIQEDSTSPLALGYITPNMKIRSTHIMKNSNKIKLESGLVEGQSFRVDIKINYIKPISSAHIADDIQILVDENKELMTKAYIDNQTIEIKTLTEIIDQRPKN